VVSSLKFFNQIPYEIISPLHAAGTANLIVCDLFPQTTFENMNSSLLSGQFSPFLCSPFLTLF
jgi:hypothetical protein